jgi:hypothetical protein
MGKASGWSSPIRANESDWIGLDLLGHVLWTENGEPAPSTYLHAQSLFGDEHSRHAMQGGGC